MTMPLKPVRTQSRAERPVSRGRWMRLLAVGAAAGAAVAGWFLITQVAGVDLRAPDSQGPEGTAAVGLGQVVVVSTLAGLAAWALL
ncbi:MAG TPA: DUF6069 family protein, partial [Streptosporangiaceae bacterium]